MSSMPGTWARILALAFDDANAFRGDFVHHHAGTSRAWNIEGRALLDAWRELAGGSPG
jgi:hypothetical protein